MQSDQMSQAPPGNASRTLLARLLVGCLVPLVAAVACQAAYTVSAQRRAMNAGLQEKARSLAELMVDVVGPSLALDDLNGVQDGLGYIRKDTDFAFALALLPDRRIAGFQGDDAERKAAVAAVHQDGDSGFVGLPGILVATRPIMSKNTTLGTVAIGLRTDNVQHQVRRTAQRVVAIAAAGIAAALTVVLLLASAVARRNRDLKLIMDNVDQGFLTVKRDGTLLPEHSMILETWFGSWSTGQSIWKYLATTSSHLAGTYQLAWENISSEFLPDEMAMSQFPSRARAGERTFNISYKAIMKGSRISQMLMVFTDISRVIEVEQAQREQRELVNLFEWLLRDRPGLLEFFAEGRRQVNALASEPAPDTDTLKRGLHTLKGNSGLFGLQAMVTLCQSLEDQLAEGGSALAEESVHRLEATWSEAERRLNRLSVGQGNGESIQLDAGEYEEVKTLIAGDACKTDLLEVVDRWRFQPLHLRLSSIAHHATQLARRLGRGDLVVNVECCGIRCPDDALIGFWPNLIHVVRNAIDHGIEPPDERTSAGKPAIGRLTLSAKIEGGRFIFTVDDDGRGIRWDKVADKARGAGLAANTPEDLVAALFHGGISTRDGVSEISGRGVGMSAVQQSCEQSGGRIRIQTEAGRGTRMEFSWPVTALIPSTVDVVRHAS